MFISGYSSVNGLNMYYEIHGSGEPLVILHGGGSTIQTSFGRVLAPLTAFRQVIGIELQAHGHTNDRNTPLSFEQDADDVAVLLNNLKVSAADFLGFSNGGNTALQVAIRHPDLVKKIVVCSSIFRRDGAVDGFWDFMEKASLDNMPQELKDAYQQVSPHPGRLQEFHDKCQQRMLGFTDWPETLLQSIITPVLIITGDADMVRPEHAVELYRLLPVSKLAIFPGGHGACLGEITTLIHGHWSAASAIPVIADFLGG